jgi:hypothetical protein
LNHLIHYLDDFLFIGVPNTDKGKEAPTLALQILGVPVVAHKTEGPATVV